MTGLNTALVIQNCPAGEFESNLASTFKLAECAIQKRADLVVFPEMNLTGYLTGTEIKNICRPVDNFLIRKFAGLSEKSGTAILVGLAEKSENGRIFASQLAFLPDGRFYKYRKIHTAPFEKKFFTPGSEILVFGHNGYNIGVQLCYDAHFPELSLSMALKKADLIVIPHASPRGTPHEKLDSWTRHLRARAFDNGIYVAACNQMGSNNKGLSFPGLCLLIGPDGNITYHSNNMQQCTLDPPGETVEDEGDGAVHMVRMDKEVLSAVRSHKMRYFLPNRRNDLFMLQ